MTTTEEQKLRSLVDRIARHQKALGLSDSDFVARYQRHLSSTRTWRQRLVNGDLRQMKLTKWVENLQRMVNEIDGSVAITTFYDLPISQAIRATYNLLQGQTNDRRCAVVLGPTGIGKTYIAKKLVAENPTANAFVETTPNCTPYHLVRCIARAVGAPEVSGIGAQTDALFDYLKGREMTVFVDEGHEAGVPLFKLVKSAINQTRTRWMLFCYPTQWSKLITASAGAWSESQQLLGRSLGFVIDSWSDGCHRNDVAAYIRAAVPELDADAETIAGQITDTIRTHGNLRLLADAIDTARMVANATDAEITPAAIREEIANLIPRRK